MVKAKEIVKFLLIKLTIGSNITNIRKRIDMERKEEIIQATLMLASKNGIDNVSMSQIATQLGIKKPSLYNLFPIRRMKL